jgi:hypothetical protein
VEFSRGLAPEEIRLVFTEPEEIRLEFKEPEEIRLEFTELEEYSTVEATPSPLFSADFGYYNYAV